MPEPVGLAICDASGVISFRKPLPEFPLPRLGAGCALWPLYGALARPMMVLEERVEQSTRTAAHHKVVAIAQPAHLPRAGKDVLFESHMLIVPESKAGAGEEVTRVGLTCRICPEAACFARREPSILFKTEARNF